MRIFSLGTKIIRKRQLLLVQHMTIDVILTIKCNERTDVHFSLEMKIIRRRQLLVKQHIMICVILFQHSSAIREKEVHFKHFYDISNLH